MLPNKPPTHSLQMLANNGEKCVYHFKVTSSAFSYNSHCSCNGFLRNVQRPVVLQIGPIFLCQNCRTSMDKSSINGILAKLLSTKNVLIINW